MGRCWTIDEIDFLRDHYNGDGIVFCMTYLDRSRMSVTRKAYTIGLKTSNHKPKNRRHIVCQLADNKVIAECPYHGKVLHYYGYQGQSLQCAECTKNSTKKWRRSNLGKTTRRRYDATRRKDPITNYANRLRSRLNYYKSLMTDDAQHGCFRYLPFSPVELYDHLEKRRIEHENKCPMCGVDYDVVGYHIDHIKPLVVAVSMDEIWSLFNLSNLSLLCPRCNGVKGALPVERSFYQVGSRVL